MTNIKQAPANFWKKKSKLRKGYKQFMEEQILIFNRKHKHELCTSVRVCACMCVCVCVEGHELKSQQDLASPPSDWHKLKKPATPCLWLGTLGGLSDHRQRHSIFVGNTSVSGKGNASVL